MSFLAPGLLGALALLSVPIIIHILNRRKFRVVEWAPMKYLALTVRTTRRRIRLEQLILLLIRMAFVAALVLAVARPTVESKGALGWAGLGATSSRFIVLDDSASMGTRLGRQSSWELARGIAVRLMESAGNDDRLTLMTTSRPESPVLTAVPRSGIDNVEALVQKLPQTDAATHWASVLEALRSRLERATFPVKEVTIISDLRRSGWGPECEEVARRMASESLRFRMIDTSLTPRSNIALISFEAVTPVSVPGVDTIFKARLRNDGSEAFGPASAELQVGDARRSVSLPRIRSGETVELEVVHRFAEPGIQSASLEIPADDLPNDDVRYAVVEVRENLDLLLVDGSPSDEPFASEIDFLSVAFTIGDVPWRTFAATDAEYLAARPPAVDLTMLANVGSLTEEHVADLESLVADGMGLMIFAGDEVDSSLYNTLLWRDGEGLLPCRLKGVREEEVEGLVVANVEESALQAVAKLAPESLAAIGARRFFEVSLEGGSGTQSGEDAVRVLARWDDRDESPVLIEKTFGRGRVLFWTTTADRGWTDWPVDPSFILAMREAGLHVAKRGVGGLNIEAGRTLFADTGSATVDEASLVIPGEEEKVLLEQEAVSADDPDLRLVFNRTTRAGIYRVEWVGEGGERTQRDIAVSPAASESDLLAASRSDLGRWLGPLQPEFVHHSAVADLLDRSGREIWRFLVGLALAFLALESMLMVWTGRKG